MNIDIIIPPILIIVGGIITWLVKKKTEELKAVEERLREEKRKIYTQLLDPYIELLSGQDQIKAIKKVTSYEYKKNAFYLCLYGSDKVISAYNSLMKFAYESDFDNSNYDAEKMFNLFGHFILEIRKDLGYKKSKLDEIDMLRGIIKDIDKNLNK
ncbi:MAG: hypothetical protein KAW92_02950 [Candidatus Cloacimonetes bacterium]|nr:hypothetical protein [Candidatus Cloacimonadota bacterium]